MEIRFVEAFLAICEELHFGRAAARLHLAQPTLSGHLRRLEQAVGATLVDRGPHGVALTEAGRAFEARARRGIAELAAAARAAADAAGGEAGLVRVGFNYPAGSRLLPGALRRLRSRHPQLRADLTELRSGLQLDALQEDRLDVGFVFGPPGAGFGYRRLLRTRLVAVVGTAHPLASRAALTFAELAGHPCILFDRPLSPAAYDAVAGNAERRGHPLDVVEVVNDSTATALIVAAGEVVGFASQIRADAALPAGLRPVALTDPEPMVEVGVVWVDGRVEPRVQRFLDCVAPSGAA